MDDRWAEGTNEAARRRFAETLTEQYAVAAGRTGAARESNTELARSFLDGTIGNLRTQAERNLDASRELVEQARRGQEAGWVLAQESTNAYADFLDSIFFCYRESVRVAESLDEPPAD